MVCFAHSLPAASAFTLGTGTLATGLRPALSLRDGATRSATRGGMIALKATDNTEVCFLIHLRRVFFHHQNPEATRIQPLCNGELGQIYSVQTAHNLKDPGQKSRSTTKQYTHMHIFTHYQQLKGASGELRKGMV
eukprot:1903869-Rhodomonas_salina.2